MKTWLEINEEWLLAEWKNTAADFAAIVGPDGPGISYVGMHDLLRRLCVLFERAGAYREAINASKK